MQNRWLQAFSQIGQRALEKSRGYYYPLMARMTDSANDSALAGAPAISDDEFAAMLREIDKLSAQFSVPRSK